MPHRAMQATYRDASQVPSKQRVAGFESCRTHKAKSQLNAHLAELIINAHDALRRRRARCVPVPLNRTS
jgi:hypothetical protein